jgi:hypothetical protein
MPKDPDHSFPPASSHERCPVGGLSEALYAELVQLSLAEEWTRSPVGGLSLPEFLRIACLVNQR